MLFSVAIVECREADERFEKRFRVRAGVGRVTIATRRGWLRERIGLLARGRREKRKGGGHQIIAAGSRAGDASLLDLLSEFIDRDIELFRIDVEAGHPAGIDI